MSIDIKKLLLKGREILEKESRQKRKQPEPAYHVSSCGLFLEKEQTTTGTCHRLAISRYFDVYTPVDPDRILMFGGGRANEEVWVKELETSGEYQLKREEEIPVNDKTTKGTPVVGNPDIVLLKDGAPQQGLELKCASSYYTVRNVYFEGKPNLAHVVQATYYSTILGIPFELWYTSRVDFHVPDRDKKSIPTNDPAVELNYKRDPKKIKCVEVGFTLDKIGETVYYESNVLKNGKQQTIVTFAQMKKFLDFCDFLIEQKDLGPRPINLEPNGKKAGYSKCDYCDLKNICDRYENQYDEWLVEVKKLDEPPF